MLRSVITKQPLANQTGRYCVKWGLSTQTFATSTQQSSSQTSKDEANPEKVVEKEAKDAAAKHKHTKTQVQLDEELRQKMMGISGDGGDAGIEYEDGQPVSMKRSVKNNMFRYI